MGEYSPDGHEPFRKGFDIFAGYDAILRRHRLSARGGQTLNEYLFEALADLPVLSDIVRGRTFEEAFVDDARFRRWFRQTQGDLAGSLRAPDVWTEIKGVIKGYLGAAKALKIDETRPLRTRRKVRQRR